MIWQTLFCLFLKYGFSVFLSVLSFCYFWKVFLQIKNYFYNVLFLITTLFLSCTLSHEANVLQQNHSVTNCKLSGCLMTHSAAASSMWVCHRWTDLSSQRRTTVGLVLASNTEEDFPESLWPRPLEDEWMNELCVW